jgi:hypothetical protein
MQGIQRLEAMQISEQNFHMFSTRLQPYNYYGLVLVSSSEGYKVRNLLLNYTVTKKTIRVCTLTFILVTLQNTNQRHHRERKGKRSLNELIHTRQQTTKSQNL